MTLDLVRQVEVEQCAPEGTRRCGVERDDLAGVDPSARPAGLPAHGATERHVAARFAVELGDHDAPGLAPLAIDRGVGPPVGLQFLGLPRHPARAVDPGHARGGSADRAVEAVLENAVLLAGGDLYPDRVLLGARYVPEGGAARDLQAQVVGSAAVAEPAVDRGLGGEQGAERLATLGGARQVQVDHRRQQAAAAVLRMHAHPGQTRRRQLGPGDGELRERVGRVQRHQAVDALGLDAYRAFPGQG
jgi:hypothetical protein